ncbi:MAG: hypothetical protein PHI31_14055 [Desulfuromonadaceae bacterium]|nr:hypothetical protein [Desulfuromonadaceae bacterium]
MGRDTTAGKRMAAKRNREKEAGLRRINVAVTPEAFGKLAELMKHHNCTSQAQLIELLVMGNSPLLQPNYSEDSRNEVTNKIQKELSVPKQQSSNQMSLFEG